jgi:hypothetical protein
MVGNLPISDRRGFELSDYESDRLGVLMVRSPIELVSAAYVELFGGDLETEISVQQDGVCHQGGVCLHQYEGHDWTIIGPFGICSTQSVIKISEHLKTRCIYLVHEDTASASSYEVFDRGTCIEEFHWGTDYTDEVWEVSVDELLALAEAREAEGNPLPMRWDPRKWDIHHVSGLTCYKFRGQSLTATEAEVVNVHRFLDRLFRAQDAWLPGWDYIPWWQKALPRRSDFVRIDCITGAMVVNEALAYLTKLFPNMQMTANGGIILAETETKDLSNGEGLEF